MASYIIALDIGTQGTKAVLFDTDMKIVSQAFEASRLVSPNPGTVWQTAEDIYSSCINTIRELTQAPGVDAKNVVAIGIDSQMAGIMGVDRKCEAVTYYDSWLDTRCEPYMKMMRERAGRKVIEVTGGPVTYTHGPKILWWKQEHPEQYRDIYKFVLPHSYVIGKLAGLQGDEIYFDYTCLQYSGFGDNYKKCWSEELLSEFSIDANKMARIVSPFEKVGNLTIEAARQCGLPQGVPLVAGAGDTASSIFGSGLFDTGMLFDCAGTASVMCSVADQYSPDIIHETMTMMRSPVDGFWFPLAYINGGGMCLKWFRDDVAGPPAPEYKELEAACASIAPGSDGVVFVPHFGGRVLPNNPNIRGSFTGLDFTHTRGHLFRAVMEGIAYEYHFYLSVLRDLYPSTVFNTMYAVGGGAKSSLFCSIKADVLGIDVVPYQMSDAALVGTAVIAGVGVGVFEDFRTPIRKNMAHGNIIRPNLQNHKEYQQYANAYLDFIEALTPVYAKYKKQ